MKTNSKFKIQNSKLIKFKICNLQSAILNSQEGIVLIVSLLLLLVATIVGIMALSTSTTNVMITGNQRLSEINFRASDSGIYVSIPVIKDIIFYGSIPATYGLDPDITIDTGLEDELRNTTLDSDCPVLTSDCDNPDPDLEFTLSGTPSSITVSVDVDRLYSAAASGSAILMFMGYEGLGTGAASGGALIYYPINSYAQGPLGSQAQIYGIYRYVTQ